MAKLDPVDVDLLMRLQYEFPLTPTPIADVAVDIGISVEEALGRLSRLKAEGILKRIGFYLNFRATGLVGALVAFNSGGDPDKLARVLNPDPMVSHNFLRSHPVYDVWAVIKARSGEELLSKVEHVARVAGVSDYVVLFSRRTLKLSVKYDLREGISRAGPWSRIADNPPRPEELSIPPSLPRELRILPLEERPYAGLAGKYGLTEEEVVSLAKEMLHKGILGDPGAALEGHKVGFKVHGMTVVAGEDLESLCDRIAESVPEATHVVLREPHPPGAWRHNCYFMVHARDERVLEDRVKARLSAVGVGDYMIIYSLRDLKPGVVR